MRVEHWDNAVEQGRVAMRNMMGHFSRLSTFLISSRMFLTSLMNFGAMRMATTRSFIAAT
jgi:hypothetical protein